MARLNQDLIDEWRASDDLAVLLHCCRLVSRRKLRLFSIAACRLFSEKLAPQLRAKASQLLSHIELSLDGALAGAALQGAVEAVAGDFEAALLRRAKARLDGPISPEQAVWSLVRGLSASEQSSFALAERAYYHAEPEDTSQLCRTLRCIVGDPFLNLKVQKKWLSWQEGTVLQIAQKLYQQRDHASLGVLADALKEAGCNNYTMFRHCRNAAPHAHGCWVLDALLSLK